MNSDYQNISLMFYFSVASVLQLFFFTSWRIKSPPTIFTTFSFTYCSPWEAFMSMLCPRILASSLHKDSSEYPFHHTAAVFFLKSFNSFFKLRCRRPAAACLPCLDWSLWAEMSSYLKVFSFSDKILTTDQQRK